MVNRRIAAIVILVLFSFALLTANAGLTFVGGASVSSGSVKGEVKIAGFGNEATTVSMTVTGYGLTAWCQNNGGNQAPGQNPVTVNSTVSQTVFNSGNGSDVVNFHVDIRPTAEVAGCPNKNWSVVDLLGTVYIDFVASNPVDGNVSLHLVCQVNERNATITC